MSTVAPEVTEDATMQIVFDLDRSTLKAEPAPVLLAEESNVCFSSERSILIFIYLLVNQEGI